MSIISAFPFWRRPTAASKDILSAAIEDAVRLFNAKEIEGASDEFTLYRWGDGEWSAEIGNEACWARLGEANGLYRGIGATPLAAVHDLRWKLKINLLWEEED